MYLRIMYTWSFFVSKLYRLFLFGGGGGGGEAFLSLVIGYLGRFVSLFYLLVAGRLNKYFYRTTYALVVGLNSFSLFPE